MKSCGGGGEGWGARGARPDQEYSGTGGRGTDAREDWSGMECSGGSG